MICQGQKIADQESPEVKIQAEDIYLEIESI